MDSRKNQTVVVVAAAEKEPAELVARVDQELVAADDCYYEPYSRLAEAGEVFQEQWTSIDAHLFHRFANLGFSLGHGPSRSH